MAAKAKRFYKTVSVAERDGAYAVLLDGRVLKTPGKIPLISPREDIAQLIADEWDAQTEDIIPATMPCTRLMNVAVERVPNNRHTLVEEITGFAKTDVLCYREDKLAALARRQAETWDPLLNWAAEQGITLKTTSGLTAIDQDGTALSKVADYAAGLDDIDLTLLAHFTNVFGSAVLGVAVMQRHITPAEGFALSRVSEDYQIEQWGEDEIAKEITDAMAAEIDALGQLIHYPK